MNKEAIQQIQVSAHIPDLIHQIQSHDPLVPTVVLPDGYHLSSLEDSMPNAARYRMFYKTTSIADFVGYADEFDQPGAQCFIHQSQMTAKTIFDLGTLNAPGHKEHSAKLTLDQTSAYQAILRLNGNTLSQKKAAEFIEDWADLMIVHSTENKTMSTIEAAVRLMDLTIESARSVNSQVEDFGEHQSKMEKIEAKNKELIPSEIHFTCIPFMGLEQRTFKLRVGILTTEEKPKIVFRIVLLDSQEELMALEFKDKLVEAFIDMEIKTFIGEVWLKYFAILINQNPKRRG